MKTHKPFVHLHTHSHYSVLDGMIKIPELIKTAKELQFPAIALTEHGNMFSAIEFYKTAVKEGVKPILGMEAYLVADHRKEAPAESGPLHRLILLAETRVERQAEQAIAQVLSDWAVARFPSVLAAHVRKMKRQVMKHREDATGFQEVDQRLALVERSHHQVVHVVALLAPLGDGWGSDSSIRGPGPKTPIVVLPDATPGGLDRLALLELG